MQIKLYNKQRDLSLKNYPVKNIVTAVLSLENIETDEVVIHFVSEKKIKELHAIYFQDPTSTDCISFPIDGLKPARHHILGEIFICPKTAIKYAKAHNLNVYEELTLYLVHGLLHLLGFDDMDSKSKRVMRRREKAHLTNLFSKKINALMVSL